MLSLGKKIRMSRLFDAKSGRILVIALDQAMIRGVMPGNARIRETMAKVVEGGPNAVTMHKGLAEHCFYDFAGRCSLILKCTSYSPYQPTYDAWVAQVDEAVRLGADAISMGVLVGGDHQAKMMENLGAVSREAAQAGLPLVAHIYPKGEGIPGDQQYAVETVSYAARLGAELGVDIVKTWYTGSAESFAKVVEACPAKVVVAGGPKLDEPRQALIMTREIVDAGAAGLTFGRNVWQYEDPTAMVRALKVIVLEDGTVAQAEEELRRQA